jgi:regulatory protein
VFRTPASGGSTPLFNDDVEPPDPRPGEGPDEPADPESVARTICLRLLDTRARTRAELSAQLRRRNVPVEAADAVLDRFTELGLIDDAALADTFALARHTGRGDAGPAIAVHLRRRGVADDVIKDALAQLDPASEAAAARSLARTRLARMGAPGTVDPVVATRRLTGLLARRGYSSAVAFSAVRDALAERPELVDADDVD